MELTDLQIKELEQTQYVIVEDDKAEKIREERRIIHFISTPQLDRTRDVMDPHGMDSVDFQNTKAVFFNHNYDLPIGSNVKLAVTNSGVKATTYFSDKTQIARDVYNLHLDGVLNAWSIGFQAVRDKKGNIEKDSITYDDEKGIRTFNKWKLLEYSSTGIPANPGALDIAKSIVKSYELNSEIDYKRDILAVQSIVENQTKEITELKSLYEALKNPDNNDAIINELKSEIQNLNTKLSEIAGSVSKKKINYDDVKLVIKNSIAGALSEFTGWKH